MSIDAKTGLDFGQILAAAVQLQQAGDLRAAVEIYRDVLQVAPDNADAHHLLGRVAWQTGDVATAEDLIARAGALRPAEPAYMLDLGRVRLAAGKFAAARECFTAVLSLDPTNLSAIEGLKNSSAEPAGAVAPQGAAATGDPAAGRPAKSLPRKLAKKDIPAAVDAGVALQQAGRSDEAAEIYRAILAADPNNADALNLLGVISQDKGDFKTAVRLLRKASQRAPQVAMVANNLGSALQAAGSLAEAVRSYERAIALDPGMAEAHLNLGTAWQDAKQGERALDCYRRAIDMRPGFAKAYQNLGGLLNIREGGRAGVAELEQAVALAPLDADVRADLASVLLRADDDEKARPHLELALALAPDSAKVQNAYGWFMQRQGRMQLAIEHYRKAIALTPDYPEAHNNLGAALNESARFEEALEPLRKALELRPAGYLEPLINLSVVLNNLDRWDEALDYVNRGLAQAPEMAELWNSSGCIYRNLAQFETAEAHFRKSLACRPDFPDALNNLGLMQRAKGHPEQAVAIYRDALASGKHDIVLSFNMGLALLSNGELEEGWPLYELRWKLLMRGVAGRFPQRWWNGEPLAGKRILLRGEQGVGDEIMFANAVGDVVAQAGEALIEVDRRLVPVFARSYPAAKVFGREDAPHPQLLDPAIDYHAPFGSLFRWLRPNLDAFPRQGGFLTADPERVAALRRELGKVGTGLVVGISWRSRFSTHLRKAEFTELPQWGPIFAVPGLTFVNLQYDESRAELAEAEQLFGIKIHHFENIDLFNDLDAAAALTAACDVVASAATSVSAMAGALGVPCYRMSVPEDWTDLGSSWTPFFPSVTLVKRRLDEGWERVIETVAARLASHAAQAGVSAP